MTPQQAVVKALCEEKTVEGFLFFTRYFFKHQMGFRFEVSEHHVQIAEKLLAVYHGETKRLIINVPPRHTKTELVVIAFTAWSIMLDERSRFLHLSYALDLTMENSSRVKDIISSPEFQALWPIKLKDDTQSKQKWYTDARGGMYSVATGGQVTGFGAGQKGITESFAGAIIIDDPVKPEDAEYDVRRKAVNRRFVNTIQSRRNHKDVPIVIIMQRLHDDDLCGFLLAGGDGHDWDVLKLQALQGEAPNYRALWPQMMPVEDLLKMQSSRTTKDTFNAQYQQNPVPDDGDFFLKDKARWYETVPKDLQCYGASDYAVTEGGGDFTEHGVFGVDPDDNIFVLDWWSGQTKADVWIDTQLDLVSVWKPQIWGGETGPIKASVEPYLNRRMRERRQYTVLRWVNHAANNKEGNARSFQALWEQGRVYLPVNQPWAEELIYQLSRFPKGTLDDKVDVCSIFARLINSVWAATESAKPPDNRIKTMHEMTFNDLRKAKLKKNRRI